MESLRLVPRALLPFAICVAFLPQLRGADDPEHNLIKNGNFEQGTGDWELVNFGKGGTMAIDRLELHNARPTLRIESFGQLTFVRQTVKVEPHTTYLFSAYIKVKDVHEDGGSGNAGALVMVGQSQYGSQGISGTADWQKVTTQINSEDKTELRVGPGVGWWASKIFGTGWFSDLSLTKMVRDNLHDQEGPGRNAITNGNFERRTYGWELIDFGTEGTMAQDPAELHDGKPALRVDAHNGMTFARQIVSVKAHTTYRLSGFIKSKDLQENGGDGSAGASLILGSTQIKTQTIAGTTDWQEVSVEFDTENKTAIRVGGSVGFYSHKVSGTAWFSGIRLTEVHGAH